MKKYFYLFLFSVLFSSLSFGQNQIGILKQNANIRWQPKVVNNPSNIIKQFNKGKVIIIDQQKKKWSYIINPVDGKTGWISNTLILKAAVLKSDANIRWQPKVVNNPSNVIKQFTKGKVVIIDQQKNKWSYIINPVDGKTGWISNSVLSSSLNSAPKTQSVVVQKEENIPPNCDYIIISPLNEDKNVDINPTIISWKHSTGSTKGYYFSIASMVNEKMTYVKNKENRSIKKLNIGYVNSYRISDLKANTKYFIGLVPYNDVGLGDCGDGLFSFTTGNGIMKNNAKSAEQIIENRLRKMNKLTSWRNFNKVKNKRIRLTDVNKFLETVNNFKGAPYGRNNNWSGIDCSGLVYRGLQSNGFKGEKLNAQNLARSGKLIANKSSLRAGDLVCFSHPGTTTLVNHIAVYLGNNEFLHSPNWGKFVKTDDINDPHYWGKRFIFGVRY